MKKLLWRSVICLSQRLKFKKEFIKKAVIKAYKWKLEKLSTILVDELLFNYFLDWFFHEAPFINLPSGNIQDFYWEIFSEMQMKAAPGTFLDILLDTLKPEDWNHDYIAEVLASNSDPRPIPDELDVLMRITRKTARWMKKDEIFAYYPSLEKSNQDFALPLLSGIAKYAAPLGNQSFVYVLDEKVDPEVVKNTVSRMSEALHYSVKVVRRPGYIAIVDRTVEVPK